MIHFKCNLLYINYISIKLKKKTINPDARIVVRQKTNEVLRKKRRILKLR